jgi:hypothetical protein
MMNRVDQGPRLLIKPYILRASEKRPADAAACETGSSCARKIAHGEPGTEAEFGGAIGRNLITTTSKARDEITEIRRGYTGNLALGFSQR